MTVNFSPLGPCPQFELATGLPAVGNKLFFYIAGTTTKQDTYTDSTGTVANANPVILNSLGQPTTEVWFTVGQSYKIVYAPSTDTDPPSSPIRTWDNLKVSDSGLNLSVLAANTGASLVGYKQVGSNTKNRTLQNKIEDITSLSEFTGIDLTGVTECATAFQNAVNNCAAREVTLFCQGQVKIATQINVLSRVNIIGTPNDFTILLATQNMNGIVYGDGTLATKSLVTNSTLQYVDFNPVPGVAQFTSGACVYKNYVAFVHTRDCTFYGLDGGTRKLFNGVVDFQAQDCENTNLRFYEIHGSARITSGATGIANRTVNGRDDFMKIQGIDGDGIKFGDNTAGMSITNPVMTLVNGWCIKIDPGVFTGSAQNFFITQPDFEVDTTSTGGIYHKTGEVVQVCGGWIGYGSGAAGKPGVLQDSTANGLDLNDVDIIGLTVEISGPASSIDGGQVTGDNSTTTVGVTVNSTATDFSIDGCRIRQWITNGIKFVGSPPRCRVNGVTFKNIGVDNITGQSFVFTGSPPQIYGCQTDHSFQLTAAATLHLQNGREFIEVTGGTQINDMTKLGVGVELVVAAGAGGITWGQTATQFMLTSAVTVQPQFTNKTFFCNGQVWFEKCAG